MNSFEINIEEVQFYKKEIVRLKKTMLELDGNYSDSIDSLSGFTDKLVKNKIYYGDEYEILAKKMIKALRSNIKNDRVKKLILDFSRIDSGLRELYVELGLIVELSDYVGRNNYEVNDYNDVLIKDLIYTDFYGKAVDTLKSDNEQLIDFISNYFDDKNYRFQSFMVQSMLKEVVRLGLLTEIEAKNLKKVYM